MQQEARFKPFAEAGGFIETTCMGGLAEIKTMVGTDNVTGDFLITGGSELQLACDEGLLEKLDWDAIGGRGHRMRHQQCRHRQWLCL